MHEKFRLICRAGVGMNSVKFARHLIIGVYLCYFASGGRAPARAHRCCCCCPSALRRKSETWGQSSFRFVSSFRQSSSSLLLLPVMQRIFDAAVGERIPGAFRLIPMNYWHQNLFFCLFVSGHDHV